MTTEIATYFEKLYKDIENIMFDKPQNNDIKALNTKIDQLIGKINKNKKEQGPSFKGNSKVVNNQPLSINEKAELKKMIMKLTP